MYTDREETVMEGGEGIKAHNIIGGDKKVDSCESGQPCESGQERRKREEEEEEEEEGKFTEDRRKQEETPNKLRGNNRRQSTTHAHTISEVGKVVVIGLEWRTCSLTRPRMRSRPWQEMWQCGCSF